MQAPDLNPAGHARNSELHHLSLAEASELLRAGKVSPVELTEACLRRIEALNPKLNAFITITGEQALAEARQTEAELRRGGRKGPLHGIPIALKDLADTAGVRTTAASGVFKDRIPAEDAEVVRRPGRALSTRPGGRLSGATCCDLRWPRSAWSSGPVAWCASP